MDKDRCAICRESQSEFACSCVFPALPVCTNCAIPHFQAAGIHIPAPIPRLPEDRKSMDPSNVNEVCDECFNKPAALFCICTVPPKKFCADCDTSHYSKAPSMIHLKHPVSAYKPVASGQVSIEGFTRRQIYVNQLQLKISENLSNLDSFITKTQNEFDAVIRRCVEQKLKTLWELQKLRKTLTTKLRDVAQVIETKRYETKYEARSWLEQLVLNGYISNPFPNIRFFACSMDVQGMLDSVSQAVTYSIHPDTLDRQMRQLPIIKEKRLWLVDVQTLDMKEYTLKQNTMVNVGSVYCFINADSVLCCGGETHRKVYEINLRTLEVTKQRQMNCIRKYAGIHCFNYEYIYIFGGNDGNNYLKSAEKYSLSSRRWEVVKGEMTEAKYACSVTAHFTGIYIAGMRSDKMIVELFNPKTENFSLLYTYSPSSYWPMILVIKDELSVYQYSNVHLLKLNSMETQFRQESISGAFYDWSNCLPIEVNGEFFGVLNSGGSISGVLKVDPAKKKIEKVKSFSY